MNFLFPGAAWFLMAVPVVIALYLLKTRRVRLEVPSLMDWKRVALDNRKRALFRKLRHPLSLILSLLILGLIILALARPALRLLGRNATRTLIVIDQRIGMQAGGPGGSRFQEAQALAARFLREAGASRQAALLGTMSGELEVVSGFSSDSALLLQSLAGMEAGDGGGSLERPLLRAAAIASGAGGEVLLITDRPVEGIPAEGVRVSTIGAPAENTAIGHFDVRRSPADAGTLDVFVEVIHAGAGPVARDLEIFRDGVLTEVRRLDLKPGELRAKSFALADSRGTEDIVFEARLGGGTVDVLAADDRACSVVPARKPGRVLLVSEGNVYLEGILAAGVVPAFEVLSPEVFRAEMAIGFDVVILDRVVPMGWSWTSPPAGNWLFCGSWPGESQGTIEAAETTWTEPAHALLRSVRLEGVRWFQVPKVVLPAPEVGWRFQVPVRSLEGPLLVAGERVGDSDQRLIAIPAPLGSSDLPLRVAFPVLIGNALAWLAGEDLERDHALPVGRPAESELQQIDPVTRKNLDVGVVRTPWKAGIYNDGERLVAVSRTDWTASDLRGGAGTTSEIMDSARRTEESGTRTNVPFRPLEGVPPWVWFALGAWGLLVLEWRLYHRRKTE